MTSFFHPVARRTLLLAALLLTPLAGAQAQAPTGPQGGSPPGPPPGPPPFAMVLLDEVLYAKLALSSGQEALWAVLDADEAALHRQRQAARAALQALVATEFAKSVPDLLLLETAGAAGKDADFVAAKKLDAGALAFYTSLDTAQQAIVVEEVKALYQKCPAPGPSPSGPPPRN